MQTKQILPLSIITIKTYSYVCIYVINDSKVLQQLDSWNIRVVEFQMEQIDYHHYYHHLLQRLILK